MFKKFSLETFTMYYYTVNVQISYLLQYLYLFTVLKNRSGDGLTAKTC